MGEGAGGVGGHAEVGGDGLCGGQVESVGEDAEVPEQALLVVGEQVVGPLDGASERDGATVAEQVERTVQPGVEVGEVERRHPSCGQFDGERHPVETAHDVTDQAQVVRIG